MSEKIITSRDNALVKQARAVRDGKVRGQIFVEGLRLCEEAWQALGPGYVECAVHTPAQAEDERGASLLASLKASGARTAIVSESVFASLSDTKTPQGILMLAQRPETHPDLLIKSAGPAPLIIILHKVGNPANAGAILRTAEAAGASGAIVTEGTTDLFAPRALRGAMGSTFRLPLWTGATFHEALSWCKAEGIRAISTSPAARLAHTEIDWARPVALIVGAESTGLTPEELAQADEALRIPMCPPVESLNVGAAAAIILYEAARQRNADGWRQARSS